MKIVGTWKNSFYAIVFHENTINFSMKIKVYSTFQLISKDPIGLNAKSAVDG
jgi:hypothetical protein